MPVILDSEEKRRQWLGEEPSLSTDQIVSACCMSIKVIVALFLLFVCFQHYLQGLEIIEVSTEVNNVRNNSPDNIVPLSEYKKVGKICFFFSFLFSFDFYFAVHVSHECFQRTVGQVLY